MSDYPMLISNKLHSFRNFGIQNYKFHHRVSQTSVQFSSYLTCLTTVFTTIYLILL